MSNLDSDSLIKKIIARGIDENTINILSNSGIEVKKWLQGFNSVEEAVKESVESIKNHPLIPIDVKVHGLIMDPYTGELKVITRGK